MEPVINQGTAAGASGAPQGQGTATPAVTPTGQSGGTLPPDVELGDDGKPLPFDQHPKWKSARATEKKVQELMSTIGVDDFDELSSLLETGKAVSGRFDLDDLDGLIEDAATLRSYREVWDEQAEQERRANEQPDEQAARLIKENRELKKQLAAGKEVEANQKVVKAYESTVKSYIKEALPNLDEEDVQFALAVLGVGNPAIDADINNKAAVIKGVKEMVKRFSAFSDRKIQKYLEGKERIPRVPGGAGSEIPAPTTGQIKNLKDARKALFAALTGQQ